MDYGMNENVMEWTQVYAGNASAVREETNAGERDRRDARRRRILRQQRRKRRRVRRMIRLGVRLGILFVAATAVLSYAVKRANGLIGGDVKQTKPYYHKTKEVSVDEVRGTDTYRYVLEHPELYPSDMAQKLERNPELLEFVEHYLEYDKSARGGISAAESREKCPLFMQWDERWGYAAYGDDNIGFSGCGPTCLSMVIYSMTRKETATPDAIGRFAMEQGYYVYGTGTSWELMTAAAQNYGVNASNLSLDEDIMKRSLDAGQLIIASMGPGDFTTSGHFIVIYGHNEEGFFVNDPNSKKRSNQVWKFDTLCGQVRNLWVYYK